MNNNNVNIEITNMKKLFSPLLRKLEYIEKDNEYVDEDKKKVINLYLEWLKTNLSLLMK